MNIYTYCNSLPFYKLLKKQICKNEGLYIDELSTKITYVTGPSSLYDAITSGIPSYKTH